MSRTNWIILLAALLAAMALAWVFPPLPLAELTPSPGAHGG